MNSIKINRTFFGIILLLIFSFIKNKAFADEHFWVSFWCEHGFVGGKQITNVDGGLGWGRYTFDTSDPDKHIKVACQTPNSTVDWDSAGLGTSPDSGIEYVGIWYKTDPTVKYDILNGWFNGSSFFSACEVYFSFRLTCERLYMAAEYGQPQIIGVGTTVYTSGLMFFTNWYSYNIDVQICNYDSSLCGLSVTEYIFKDGSYYISRHYKDKKASPEDYGKDITDIFKLTKMQLQNLVSTLYISGQQINFLFNDGTYLRYDLITRKFTSKYPQLISTDFKGITQEQSRNIRAGIYSSKDKSASFFLKDGTYIRYNMESAAIIAGYPRQISQDFVGFIDSDAVNLSAVTRDDNENISFIFKDGHYLQYDEKQKGALAKVGMLSTDLKDIPESEAANILSVIQY